MWEQGDDYVASQITWRADTSSVEVNLHIHKGILYRKSGDGCIAPQVQARRYLLQEVQGRTLLW